MATTEEQSCVNAPSDSPSTDEMATTEEQSCVKVPETPTMSRKRPQEAVAVVTPDTDLVTRKKTKAAKTDWRFAMSIFSKFQPGLGHDGVGLYGTLTPASALKVLERLDLKEKTHLDVGAADGKMMLGALALGASKSFGIEIAGDCLEAKFDAMKRKLEAKVGPLEAKLACNTDVCLLEDVDVSEWLRHLFQDDSSDIVVTAVWHGFTIESKQTLLRAIASAYPRVTRFSLIGPMRKDYGDPDDVIDFLTNDCGIDDNRVILAHHDHCTLAGGEAHRALTFHLLP